MAETASTSGTDPGEARVRPKSTTKMSHFNSKERDDSRSESPDISHLEDGKQPRLADNTDEDEEFSYAEQRKIVHRIDRRLLVITGLMYCVSLIDRGNMPNAAIAGMHDDLETNVGYRYVSTAHRSVALNSMLTMGAQSVATLVFFITYTIFQPPATVVVRKLGPRNFLPGICVAWGIVMVSFVSTVEPI